MAQERGGWMDVRRLPHATLLQVQLHSGFWRSIMNRIRRLAVVRRAGFTVAALLAALGSAAVPASGVAAQYASVLPSASRAIAGTLAPSKPSANEFQRALNAAFAK